MIKLYDKKVTANELAKWLVYDRGTGADYWTEDTRISLDLLTEKETDEINRLVDKHSNRVRKLLGIEKVADKIWPE